MLGILNGLARESAILINTLTGSIIRIAAIWFLMPILGVDAYIYAVIAGSIITIAFNFREISKITGISIDAGQWLIKPISAAMAGVFFTFIIKTVLTNWNMQARIYRLLIVITAFLTLATIFIVTGIIKKDDLKRWIIRKH
jgi:stage V sporulation protein B